MKEIFDLLKEQIPILITLKETVTQVSEGLEFLVILGMVTAIYNLPETIIGISKTIKKIEQWLRYHHKH